MLQKTGLPVSSGIAIAKAVILDSEMYQIPKRSISQSLCDSEVQRVTHAFEMAIAELLQLETDCQQLESAEIRNLFTVHRSFLKDQSLRDKVAQRIRQDCVTAEYAVSVELQSLHQHFSKVADLYIRERAADILDMEKRLLRHLIDLKKSAIEHVTEEVVIVAKELHPTETAAFDPRFVKGIVCDTGGGYRSCFYCGPSYGYSSSHGRRQFDGEDSSRRYPDRGRRQWIGDRQSRWRDFIAIQSHSRKNDCSAGFPCSNRNTPQRDVRRCTHLIVGKY